MKKFGIFLAAMLMSLSLTACSDAVSDILESRGAASGSGSSSGSSSSGTGYIEGDLGDTMKTAWFDFELDSAVLQSEYDGYVPEAGDKLLVLDVTMENTFNEPVPMFDNDFDVEWDDPDSYELPVLLYVDGDALDGEEYNLPRHGDTDVTMVFEVPEDVEEFILYFDEYYEDGTDGDVFAVYFAPTQG